MKTTIAAARTMVVLVCLLVGVSAKSASAQEFGGRIGVSGDPTQFYLGPHVKFGPIVPPNLFFKPNLEFGVGDNLTYVGLNFEFTYDIALTGSLRNKPWQPYVGAGPVLAISHVSVGPFSDTSTDGAFNILFGAEHRNGISIEMKFGIHAAPTFKLGIGYTFK